MAGKKNSIWYARVTGTVLHVPSGIIKPFTEPNWFPNNDCTNVTETGSMECPVLKYFFQHIQLTARKYLDANIAFLLYLDGNSSRKHPKWIDCCSSSYQEAAINALNTSHILQPCDQLIIKRFHRLMCQLQKESGNQRGIDTASLNFSAACAVYAWARITQEPTQAFSKVTKTFPLQRNFAAKYKAYRKQQLDRVNEESIRLGKISVASRLDFI